MGSYMDTARETQRSLLVETIVRNGIAKYNPLTGLYSIASQPPMAGKSNPMMAVFHQINLNADNASPVLLAGEEGTGKRSVAKALHFNSQQRHTPEKSSYVFVNCAQPEARLEAELFGYESPHRPDGTAGKFELAADGTIFFNDIEKLTSYLQARLLDVIEQGMVHRPTDGQTVHLGNMRIVASTTHDIDALVKAGALGKDLFRALYKSTIYLPTLQERGEEDIGNLVMHFLGLYGRQEVQINDQALARLKGITLRGNVRSLEYAVFTATKFAGSDGIVEERHIGKSLELENAANSLFYDQTVELEPLEIIERDHILRTLESVNGNKKTAAEILGISRRALYRKLERHDMEDQIKRRSTDGDTGSQQPESPLQ